MNDIDQWEENLIERIKSSFPKNLPDSVKRKVTRSEDSYYSDKLRELLKGNRWEEVISQPYLIYYLSEVDCLREITDEAYLYYLPSYLIATLLYPEKWVLYSLPLEKMRDLGSRYSLEQVETIISYCELCIASEGNGPYSNEEFIEALEDTQLRFMLRRDELQSGAGKPDSS